MNSMLKNYLLKGAVGVVLTALVGYTIKAERDVNDVIDEKYPTPSPMSLFKKK